MCIRDSDEGLFESGKPLTRADVKVLLDKYLVGFKTSIEDFRIHYLNGQIEVEIIVPFALSKQPLLLAALKKQSKMMRVKVNKINNVTLFFKHHED